ncbi:MAG: hypothetical protein ACYCYR_09495 [Desulfobulbaceae bacterium]
MKSIRVNFETRIPDGASDEQILEWLLFHLAGLGMQGDNPLVDVDIEADWSSVDYKDA